MPVNTGVSPSVRNPQSFHAFAYSQGGRSLVPLTPRVLLIGTQKGGTAVAGAITQINDPVETDALYGVGSSLALMCRKAFDTSALLGRGPQLFACGVAEPGGGTARASTFTVTGPATAAGNVVIRVSGRTFTIGVAVGDTATTIAVAIAAAINAAKQYVRVTAVAAAGVVTCTDVQKGVGGNDVVFEAVSAPAGVTNAWVQTIAGAGTADETTALANAAGPDFDGIALENHVSGDITLALAHVTTAWTAGEKKWRWITIGEPGTLGTATPLASAANDRAIAVINCNGSPSLPGEFAAAAIVALFVPSRPNGNWDGMQLPLYPPYDAQVMTTSQIESALAAGVTPLMPVINNRVTVPGVLKIVKFVTTCTTQNSQPFEALRDIAVPRTGAFIARQIDAAFAARFSASAANPDGALMTDDIVPQIRDMVANILYAMQAALIVKNVDADLQQLVVEPDPNAPGRVNIDVAYTVVLGLHQVAFVHRVKI